MANTLAFTDRMKLPVSEVDFAVKVTEAGDVAMTLRDTVMPSEVLNIGVTSRSTRGAELSLKANTNWLV